MMEGAGFDHERAEAAVVEAVRAAHGDGDNPDTVVGLSRREESEPGAMLPFGTTPIQQQKREGSRGAQDTNGQGLTHVRSVVRGRLAGRETITRQEGGRVAQPPWRPYDSRRA